MPPRGDGLMIYGRHTTLAWLYQAKVVGPFPKKAHRCLFREGAYASYINEIFSSFLEVEKRKRGLAGVMATKFCNL